LSSSDTSSKPNLVIAATLVDAANNVSVKARVMNPYKSPILIRQDQVVGQVEAVDEVISLLAEEENPDEANNNSGVRRIQMKSCDVPLDVTRKAKECKSEVLFPQHLKSLYDNSTKGCNACQKSKVKNLLVDFQGVFSRDKYDLGLTHLTEHVIDTGDARPVRQPPRRTPIAFAGEDLKSLVKMQKQGIIRPSTGAWASPIVLVRKKNGEVRHCVDYRRLNAVTKKDAFPIPRVSDCLDAVSGSCYFSTLDITSAYHQIPVRKTDIPKTAFATKFGLYEYITMPFGLCNASPTFQRVMEIALSGLQWTTCLIYQDDVIIPSRTFDEHITRLRLVFERIGQAGLKLRPEKCELLKPEVVFLGHVVTRDGVLPNPSNVSKLVHWPTPQNVTDVRAILGMGSYYRRFIRNFSILMKPLIDLTKAKTPFAWSAECCAALEVLKQKLTSPEVMAYPMENCHFILDTDASNFAIGAVLSQVQNGVERPVAYGSRTLSKSERNYCVTDKELLAARYLYYKHYLLGMKFTVRSDHQV
jgi:hypothetical protein